MPGSNYNYSTGEFLFDSPGFNSSHQTTPQLTSKPVNQPTFDPEEGMYDAYIEARNASIGADASKRKQERFYKKFRKQWDQGEALRKSEFNWNQGMTQANQNIDNARQNIMGMGKQIVQDFKNSFKPFENSKPVVNTPIQQESAYARAKREGNTRSLVGQDPYAAAAISAEEQNITPTTRGFGNKQVSVNPDDFGYNSDQLVSPTKQNNIFSSNTANSAGKKFTGTFNNMDEFNNAFTDWYGKRKGFWSGGSYNEGKKWDSARDQMLQEYLKYHNMKSLPEQNSQQSNNIMNNFYSQFGNLPYKKQGGNINKYQQGGNMNDQELQKAFMAYLIEDAAAQGMQIQSEQDLQAYAQQLGEEGLKAKYQEFMQKMQGGVKAALGAKLNYIHKLKGNCPDGYEMIYMKQGGRVCPVCQKKAEKAKDGKKVGNSVSQWKVDRAKAKDEAARDSIAINKYSDQDTMIEKGHKGKFNPNKKNESGGATWEPDRSKYKKAEKNACGSKMKKKK